MSGHDDFYVGWQDQAPAGLRSFLARTAATTVLALALVAGLVAASQAPLADGRFEFGAASRWTGRLVAAPVLVLAEARRDDAPEREPATLVLVGRGKRGAPAELFAHDGRLVSLRGSLIERGGDLSMLEVHEIESSASTAQAPSSAAALGPATLVGELVDTKCWLGVMRPATGKVHRACAARCLAGGVPPGLLVRLGDGDAVTVLLVAGDGSRLDIPSRLAARELRVTGELETRDGALLLRASRWDLLGSTQDVLP